MTGWTPSSLLWVLALGVAGCSAQADFGRPIQLTRLYFGGDAWGLALDDTRVYWSVASSEQGTLYSALKNGEDRQTLATGLYSPHGLLLRDGWLYVAVEGDGTIRRLPLDGGALETIRTGQENVDELAADDQNLYWTNFSVGSLGGAGEVRAAPWDGGASYPLGIDYLQPEALAVDDAGVYWAARGAVAFDRYGTPYYPNGVVYRSPKDGSGPQLIASRQLDLHTLTSEPGRLYWASNGDGQHGGTLVTLDTQSGATSATAVPYDVWTVAPTAGGAFVSGLSSPELCPSYGYLAFFPWDGGTPTDYSLPSFYANAIKMRVDDQAVYVTDPCAGVFRVQR